tara:strand:- start:2951 stop:3226 length:276 start_codon:yes stop_codon:yes gene_type:complete
MCDLTDYNKCPQCGGFLMNTIDFEVCKQCGWKREIKDMISILSSAQPGTTLESEASGCIYTKTEEGDWLCLNRGSTLSASELYAEEGYHLT